MNIEELNITEIPIYEKLLKLAPTFRNATAPFIKKLNERQRYQKSILECYLNIHNLLDTLKLSRLFLGERLEQLQLGVKSKISNSEHIKYHIENYFVRSGAFKDLILKAINRTYNFNLGEKNGLETRLLNCCSDNAEIKECIEMLNRAMHTILPIRNQIAHGSYYNDFELLEIETRDILKNHSSALFTDTEYLRLLEELLKTNILDMFENEKKMMEFLIYISRKLNSAMLIIESQL